MHLNSSMIKKIVKDALIEDAASQDITTLSFIPQKAKAEARIFAKEGGILCGVGIAKEVFKTFDPQASFKIIKGSGHKVRPGETIAVIKGRARSILSCERVALNFISYLSGISSETFKAVSKVRSKGIQVLDTRKTTPTLRILEKYAVAVGHGKNHRLDLSEQYLVKDNHLSVLRSTGDLGRLDIRETEFPFEIEVDNLKDLKKTLAYCPDIVLLDNFTPEEIKKAVTFIRRTFPKKDNRPLVELSGGITFENISRFAIRGVDFISLGSLTHSSRALDVSLEITKVSSR